MFKDANTSAWKCAKHFMKCAKRLFTFGWNPHNHRDFLDFCWKLARVIGKSSIELIETVPDGFAEGCDNIYNLCPDAPFGWIPRVLKNILWNCLKGLTGAVLISPLSLVAMGTTWLSGNIGGLLSVAISGLSIAVGALCSVLGLGTAALCSIISFAACGFASFFPLIGGFVVSTLIALGSVTNRFPKESDHGHYGLYRCLTISYCCWCANTIDIRLYFCR